MQKITGDPVYLWYSCQKTTVRIQVAVDCLPFRRIDCRLRLFLLLLLFLLQNQNVRILPNHILLWLHGRLQLGPWNALRNGEWFPNLAQFLKLVHPDRIPGNEHLCPENLCDSQDRLKAVFIEAPPSHVAIQMACRCHDSMPLSTKVSLRTHFSDDTDCFSFYSNQIQSSWDREGWLERGCQSREDRFTFKTNLSNWATGFHLKAQYHLTVVFALTSDRFVVFVSGPGSPVPQLPWMNFQKQVGWGTWLWARSLGET